MLLLSSRCRVSVEISAQQFPKIAYVMSVRIAACNNSLFQSSMQLFVFYSYSAE